VIHALETGRFGLAEMEKGIEHELDELKELFEVLD